MARMVRKINVNWFYWSIMQYYYIEKTVVRTSKDPYKMSETPTFSIHSHPYSNIYW